MDVRLASCGLPLAVAELEIDGPLPAEELWEHARAYNRLRRRLKPSVSRTWTERLSELKVTCVYRALLREPDLFLVFVDPGMKRFWLVYQIRNRSLLHLPVDIELIHPDITRVRSANDACCSGD